MIVRRSGPTIARISELERIKAITTEALADIQSQGTRGERMAVLAHEGSIVGTVRKGLNDTTYTRRATKVMRQKHRH